MGGGTLAAPLTQKLLACLGLPVSGRLHPPPWLRVQTGRRTEVSSDVDDAGPHVPVDLGEVGGRAVQGCRPGLLAEHHLSAVILQRVAPVFVRLPLGLLGG